MKKTNDRLFGLVIAAGATLGLLLAVPAVANAQPVSTGPAFGHHVSDCAQTMGFNADHNPGMHRGAAGWDGMPC